MKPKSFIIQIFEATKEHKIWLSVQEAAQQFVDYKSPAESRPGRKPINGTEPANRHRGIMTNIYAALNGRFESAYGCKWVYIDGGQGLDLSKIQEFVNKAHQLYLIRKTDWNNVPEETIKKIISLLERERE